LGENEIEAIRALLSSKPRPAAWAERRARLDEVGSVWPVADDVKLEAVDLGGVPGEWSIVPGSGPRGRRAHARGLIPAGAGASISGGARGCAGCLALSAQGGHRGRAHRGRWGQCRRRADGGADHPQGLSGRTGRCLSARRDGPEEPARLAAVRRSQGLPADDSSRSGPTKRCLPTPHASRPAPPKSPSRSKSGRT
jgi:hypothetical protein